MPSARPKDYRSARTDAAMRARLAGLRAPLAPAPRAAITLSDAPGGAGLAIAWGWFETPFGAALALGTEAGLCGLGFAAETGREAAFADLAGRFPAADLGERPEALGAWVADPEGAPLHLIGAPFQRAVWQALTRIPGGKVATYSDLAVAVGHPTAHRAVATAVGRNPVSWHVPCHRVLRRDGALGGYHWGLSVKRAMLAFETEGAGAAPVEDPRPPA
jgi:AraC family transcriptional regulator of adaptative response/methylated-DNA-[protein]-cysteine methyltransferase